VGENKCKDYNFVKETKDIAIPLMMTESTQENIPMLHSHRNATLTDSDTSITNEQIEAYEAEMLDYQQTLYAEDFGWVDDQAQLEEQGMEHDYRMPEF
jgi:hypothetical protein